MLNLIKNEYAKIFHKKNTYILLTLLLVIIVALPIFSKFIKSSNEYYYGQTYEEAINWAKEDNEKEYVEMYKKAQELEIPEDEFFHYSDTSSWRVDALYTVYTDYWYTAYCDNESNDELKKESEKKFNEGIKFVETNDWKGFYQSLIDEINSNSDLSDSEKEAQRYTYQYMVEHDIEPGTGSWQEDAANTYSSNVDIYSNWLKAKENGEYYDEEAFATAERLTLISKYRLDNDISAAIYESDDEWADDKYTYTGELYNNLKNGSALLVFVLIIIIVIAGGIISKEFSQGTIKFLLINPVKRNKIFWSKYLTLLSYSLFLTVMTFVLEFIMSLIVFGPSEINTQLLLVTDGQVAAQSGLLFSFERYMLIYVEIFVAFTIAFMISSLFRNSALAIALSIIIYFVGSTVCQVAALFNLDFFRYTIFATMDLSTILDGNSLFVHMTAEFALVVIAVHIVLLLLTAHDAFTKKNV